MGNVCAKYEDKTNNTESNMNINNSDIREENTQKTPPGMNNFSSNLNSPNILQEELNKIKKENEIYKQQNHANLSAIQSLQEKNKSIENENSKYKHENDDLKTTIKEKDDLLTKSAEKLNESKNKLEEIKNELDNKNNEIEEYKKKLNEKENQIGILKNSIKVEKEKLQTENLKLKESIAENIKLKNEFNQKITQINLTNESLKRKNEENENKIKELEKFIPITVGLDNIGATCYMNATLQSLSSVKELMGYCVKKEFNSSETKTKEMSYEFCNVIKNLWDIKNHGKSYAPYSFKETLSKKNPMFAGVAANDSKDLINFLLEILHQELNAGSNENFNTKLVSPIDQLDEKKMFDIFYKDMKERYQSVISNLFYGILETKSQCSVCTKYKHNFQVYSFLEFPLQQVNEFCFKNNLRLNYNGQGNPDIDLYECFRHYQNVINMDGNNQIYCNICNKLCDSLYGTFLYTLPNYLILNLNRGKNAVYKCNVIFPQILNLTNFVICNQINSIFQLKAVICHIGPSSMGGHFVAYCKHYKDNNNWYKYNDAIVTKCVNHKEYLNGMPYILFYEALNKD